MRQRKIWVATFNGAACHVYAYNGVPRALEAVDGGVFAQARKPVHRDVPTRVHESTGNRRSATQPETDPEHALEDAFAADVARFLDAAARNHLFDDLIVAASPRALGAFRKIAPKTLTDTLMRELSGDYVNADQGRLLSALQNV